MKKAIILLGILSVLVSCKDNKVKTRSLPVQNILSSSAEDMFMGLESVDIEMNERFFDVSKVSNNQYEIHTSKDEMLKFIKLDVIKVNLSIDDVVIPKGIVLKKLKLSLSDSMGNKYFTSTIDKSLEEVSFAIKGRENILNFISRKKFLNIDEITLLDFERNKHELKFDQVINSNTSKCLPGYHKETIKTIDRECLNKDFVSIVSILERRAVIKEYLKTTNVTFTKHKNGISVSGDKRQHLFELEGFKFQKIQELIFTELHSFTQLNLNPIIDSYFVGISHYENDYGEFIDRAVLEGGSKGNYFVDGNFIDSNHFGKSMEYEVLREAAIDIIVFE